MENDTVSAHAAAGDSTLAGPTVADTVLVEDELLVEEISIDGMCGVY
jgi:mycofactocin precursor